MDHFSVLKEQVEDQEHDFYGSQSSNQIENSKAFSFSATGKLAGDYDIQLIGHFNQENAVAAGVMKSNPLKERGFIVGDYSKENYDRIDLHRPYVDEIVLANEAGEPMKREDDLIDVWFDSGSMPYAQLHYPFEGEINKDGFG